MPRLPSKGALVYVLLVVLRIYVSQLPSYIHPDEFFQGPEIAAAEILQVGALRTWEFGSQPIRSIGPIFIFNGPPFLILRLLRDLLDIQLTPQMVFKSERLFSSLLSLVIDWCIYRALRRSHTNARLLPTMLLLASAHCLVVFGSHTFANSSAAVLVAVCLDIASAMENSATKSEDDRKPKCRRLWIVLGMMLALGTFTHISFPMFALPFGIMALVLGGIHGAAMLAMGGLLTTAALVGIDSWYYDTPLVCTVLNNIVYNSSEDNLALHGTHPRYLHLVSSMPTLFGPLYLAAIWAAWRSLQSSWRAWSGLSLSAAASVVSGLALLSLAPHQEPRFMVPAIGGMVVSTWWLHRHLTRAFWVPWVVFNVVLAAAFGVVHQAGVVPVVHELAETSVFPRAQCQPMGGRSADYVCGPSPLLFSDAALDKQLTTRVFAVSTYLLPRHLLLQADEADEEHAGARVDLVDLVGMSDKEKRDRLLSAVLVGCDSVYRDPRVKVYARTGSNGFERALLVAPASLDVSSVVPKDGAIDAVLVSRKSPHVNFDHIGRILQQPAGRAALEIFVLCAR
ncbi:alpha 1,2 mannosyltransferase [Coemansia sp. Benny D115]|nr:alpha 1,2 mannosyltransferase [Coemansia sp. Benny D115]